MSHGGRGGAATDVPGPISHQGSGSSAFPEGSSCPLLPDPWLHRQASRWFLHQIPVRLSQEPLKTKDTSPLLRVRAQGFRKNYGHFGKGAAGTFISHECHPAESRWVQKDLEHGSDADLSTADRAFSPECQRWAEPLRR